VRAGTPFDAARDQSVAGVTERDRRLAHQLAAGVLRRQRALDAALDLSRADPRLHDILRLGAYQLHNLARVPAYAAVSTSVDLARRDVGEQAAKFVNHVLRKLAAAESTEHGAIQSHPEWLHDRWITRYGPADTAALEAWNDGTPALTIQAARWDADTLAARMRSAGFGVEEAPFGAGLRVRRDRTGVIPATFPGFAEGGFVVQDPAHALVCRFAAIPPGALVYDGCAAPGGKAIALEKLGARVIAGDTRRDRLPRLLETARRSGVAIRVLLADLLTAPFGAGSLDAVLVDAPCTATGTMARHPDARWRLTERAIARAARRQRTLLAAAARLVRPGGVLVYATCSLEPEENVAIVEHFLAAHPGYSREAVTGTVPTALLTAAGDLQSFPPRDGVDGAYAARLVRHG
jgi:16S rRNA (cytosine967-C5)-methyltransferase